MVGRLVHFDSSELQALLKCCLDANVETVRQSGKPWAFLFCMVQKRMAQNVIFPPRTPASYRNKYLAAHKSFKKGKLNSPEAHSLWGHDVEPAQITGELEFIEIPETSVHGFNVKREHCVEDNVISGTKTEAIQNQEPFGTELLNEDPPIQESEKNCSICKTSNTRGMKPLLTQSANGNTYWDIIQDCLNIKIFCDGDVKLAICEKCSSFIEELFDFVEKCRKNLMEISVEVLDSYANKNDCAHIDEIMNDTFLGFDEGEQESFLVKDEMILNDIDLENLAKASVEVSSEQLVTVKNNGKRKRGINIKSEERQLLLKNCIDLKVEKIRVSGKGRWLQLLGKVRERMIEGGFPVRSVKSLQIWYKNAHKAFNAGKLAEPEAKELWGTHITDDESDCEEDKKNDAASETINQPKQNTEKEFSDKVLECENISNDTEILEEDSKESETNNYEWTDGPLNIEFTKKQIREQTRLFRADVAKLPRQCDVCGVVIRGGDFVAHMQIHSAEEFTCTFCDRVFANIRYLRRHENIHTKKRQYSCKYCERVFHSWTTWKDHEILHIQKGKHKCSECGNEYARKARLTDHYRSKHLGLCKYRCKQCDFVTHVKKRLFLHVRCKHTDLRPFGCPFCENKTNNESNNHSHFQRHKRNGEASVYQIKCAYCSELFVKDAAFEIHLVKRHPDKSVEL
ncbi:zinc finger protein 82 homolog [Uranotaenia lowii]|uniref:zinc finger protein 82 homolog n=1 Tax=Uranotaenia lowii TaxID=190385 RepID=UPI00247AFBBF|nr:zinc finger protein 82 homolog [Uranotaenia lowii]